MPQIKDIIDKMWEHPFVILVCYRPSAAVSSNNDRGTHKPLTSSDTYSIKRAFAGLRLRGCVYVGVFTGS